jgi:hypothetical protein
VRWAADRTIRAVKAAVDSVGVLLD